MQSAAQREVEDLQGQLWRAEADQREAADVAAQLQLVSAQVEPEGSPWCCERLSGSVDLRCVVCAHHSI